MFGFCYMNAGLQKVPANDMRNGNTQRQLKTDAAAFCGQ
jgi:hypothetical protein